ncbi:outer membrane protein assembly factor BamB [Thiohalocapsa sp. ML1]|uniref:outer membrane protein assembly factor BamB n=1 Tax=Thiohalocapsa sp. ML1 TaxID=1431688 RepID=UPI0007324243|nr:outer membrane protein assembly factor BamB [Thiohalocapsa sp. ML1]
MRRLAPPAADRTTRPGAPSPRVRLAGLLAGLLAAALALTGCANLPGLGGERDPTPPTKLDKKMTQRAQPRVLWKTRIGKGTNERQLRLRPAVAGGRVFAADPSGVVAALSATDGRTLWERKTRLPFSGGPDVQGEVLVLGTTKGDLLTLSTRDGAQRWRTQLDSEVVSVPRIIGDLVLVHTVDDTVYAIELADGAERWRYELQGQILSLHGASSPVPTAEGVVVGVSGGRLVHLELERGAPLWEAVITPPRGRSELDRIADLDADPVVTGDTAFVVAFNGDLAAVDIPSGQVLWRRELSSHAGLTADASRLYVTDSDDNLWAADQIDGAGIWRQEGLRHRRLSAPALLGNTLAVGDLDGYVHLVSADDGQLLGFERVTKGRIGHQPVVAGGVAYVYADDGTVAALRAGATGAAGGGGGSAAVRAPALGIDALPDLSPVMSPPTAPTLGADGPPAPSPPPGATDSGALPPEPTP